MSGLDSVRSALSLEGRTAVVLGGTSGIGRAISLGLAAAGADVVAAARRAAEVAETADAIEAAGRKTLRLTADVTKRDTLQALCDATLAAFGKVDILVNCAGKTKRLPAMDYDEASWNDIMDVNLTGTLRGCQVFGKPMLDRGYGRIINIASLTTFVAFHETAPYGASKAAVGALTKSLAIEWGPRGVVVNAIAPGVFRTALNEQLLDGTDAGARSSCAHRADASARSRRSRARRCFSRRTRPASSTGTSWSSTAVTSPAG